ncbi:hypothetical protein ACFX5U_01790 [Sphingobacterium sp. SG20118]|uniref:hypothetical protein n=1 Tax=unclassified Sphingobacterium TaxID=2609468 RepID=UPI0004F58887|nr:hypothetical protein [Sphingobacterium sp. ML3W]AIM35809.1 hypothetical protein KO02_03295 [Sphingobacterium sp. ML3W]
MNNLKDIKLTNEFKQFCDIFNFTPEKVIQDFVDKVDIAQYMCFPMDPDRWANLFMMEYLIKYTESENALKGYLQFGEKWVEIMRSGDKNAVEKTKKLLENWHKAVLEERINKIMNADEGKLEE